MLAEKQFFVPLTYDFPVNVQIWIEPVSSDTGYRVRIVADDWDPGEFFIQLRQEDVKRLNYQLRIAIEAVSDRFSRDNTDPKERRKALSELAEQGIGVFNEIFEGELRDTIRKVLKTGKVIQITSNDFIIPWDLLYDDSQCNCVRAHILARFCQ
jgi:hypothetical protein